MKHLLLIFIFILHQNVVLAQSETLVEVESQGWKLIGDLQLPSANTPVPAVIMFNRARGTRAEYKDLAEALAKRGIASLRIDLPGHGESTNLGKFVPGEVPRSPMIWDAEVQVKDVHAYLKSNSKIDANKICIIGGSYSGEESAEAGRLFGYANAYVMLSPGSFSEESTVAIDESKVPWLYITAKEDPYLTKITALIQEKSKTAEVLILPGGGHGSTLFNGRPELNERIAVWVESVVK